MPKHNRGEVVTFEMSNGPVKGQVNRPKSSGRGKNASGLAQIRRRQRQQGYSIASASCDVESGNTNAVELNVEQEKLELTYLHALFVYLNFLGISPYRFDKNNKRVTWVYNVPYYIVTVLAALTAMVQLKIGFTAMMFARATTQIKIYMDIFYTLAGTTLVGMFAVSLYRDSNRYAKLMVAIDESSFAKELRSSRQAGFAASVCAVGFIHAVTSTLDGIEFGIDQLLRDHFEKVMIAFHPEYEPTGETTVVAIIVGSLGLASTFAINLIHRAAVSGLLLAALTLAKCCANFRFKEPPSAGLSQFTHAMELWRQYEELKNISKAVNSSIFRFLRVMMLKNLFLWPVFVDSCFDGEVGNMKKLGLFVDVVICCSFLYLANKSAKRGDRFRDWLGVRKNRVDMNMLQTDVLLEGQSEQSIGIGRGALYINDALILGYGAAIGAYFFGIVETRQAQNGPGECGDCNCDYESAVQNFTSVVETLCHCPQSRG